MCVDKKVVSFIGGTNNLILTIRASKNVLRKTPTYTVTKCTLHRRQTTVHLFVIELLPKTREASKAVKILTFIYFIFWRDKKL